MGTGSTRPPADLAHVLLYEALQRVQAALDYVLPYVHVDVRDKALQIERGDTQPEGER